MTIFVTDMGHFPDVVELRRTYFSEPYPADTIAEIKALYDPKAMIEIEAIAAIDEGHGFNVAPDTSPRRAAAGR